MRNVELPEGWVLCQLQDIVLKIMGGGTPSKNNIDYFSGTIPFMTVKDMKEYHPKDTIDHITSEALENSSTKLIPAGTPIISTRMGLGKIVNVNYDVAINQDLKAIFLDKNIDHACFEYWYRSISIQIEAMGKGTTVKGITLEQLNSLIIPLLPLAEQHEIATRLATLLAQVDSIKARLDGVPALLKRFRQAVLAAAVSGRLTEEWRKEKSVMDVSQWENTPLSAICQKDRVITYGVIKLGEEVPNGIPCLRTSNVRWLNIDIDGIKRIDKNLSDEYSRTILKGSEVLVNVRGTLGGIAVVPMEMVGWNVSREVAIIPADNTIIDSFFLAFWIASNKGQQWLSSVEKGVAYVGINLEDLRTLPVSPPPLPEQTEIVSRVETLFAFADQLEARVQAAQAQVNQLTQAILAKAFRGELTAQWRKENPDLISGENSASALLARIQGERGKTEKPAKKAAKPAKQTRKSKSEAPQEVEVDDLPVGQLNLPGLLLPEALEAGRNRP